LRLERGGESLARQKESVYCLLQPCLPAPEQVDLVRARSVFSHWALPVKIQLFVMQIAIEPFAISMRCGMKSIAPRKKRKK
jgi:hypothetical protein